MIYMERHDDVQNLHRFYGISTERDLFGAWIVRQCWGRVGSPNGRTLRTIVATPEEAVELESKIARAKCKRGYR